MNWSSIKELNFDYHGDGYLRWPYSHCVNVEDLTLDRVILSPTFTQSVGMEHSVLQTLALNNCDIPDDACTALVHSLQSPHCVLKTLTLASIEPEQSLVSIVTAILGNNCSLKRLILKDLSLSILSVPYPLSTDVVNNNNLQELKLTFAQSDHFDERGVYKLIEAVSKQSVIKKLKFPKHLEECFDYQYFRSENKLRADLQLIFE